MGEALPNGMYYERLFGMMTPTVVMDVVATPDTSLDELTAFFHDAVEKEGGDQLGFCSRAKVTIFEAQHKGRSLAPNAPITLKEIGVESGEFIRLKFQYVFAVGLCIPCLALC